MCSTYHTLIVCTIFRCNVQHFGMYICPRSSIFYLLFKRTASNHIIFDTFLAISESRIPALENIILFRNSDLIPLQLLRYDIGSLKNQCFSTTKFGQKLFSDRKIIQWRILANSLNFLIFLISWFFLRWANVEETWPKFCFWKRCDTYLHTTYLSMSTIWNKHLYLKEKSMQ